MPRMSSQPARNTKLFFQLKIKSVAKKNTEHVTFRNQDLFCSHCGSRQKVAYPVEIDVMSAMLKAFAKSHADCEKTWVEPVAKPGLSVAQRAHFWWSDGERGMSSETIYSVMTHEGMPVGRSHPHDPDDFRRCYLLLKLIPEWRERIADMKQVSKAWANLADNWGALTGMLEEMMAGKKSSAMHDFMQTLIQ